MATHHFSPIIKLTDIFEIGGSKMQGASVNDYTGFNFGKADINGDGLSDLIVCSDGYDGGGLEAGGAFVIYGKKGGISPLIDFANLSPADGFVIQGEFAFDLASRMIAGTGDINGDSIQDMFIGAFKNDEGGTDSGAAYIIYGQTEPFDSPLDLYGLAPDKGMKIIGEAAGDYASFSVASAGDFNSDGIDDLIMGSPQNDGGGDNAGAAYIIFGRTSDYPGQIKLSALDATTGFKIKGATAGDNAGLGVAGIGDINGDGVADVAIGAPQSDSGATGTGKVYIVYGGSNVGAMTLSALTAQQGFVIHGEAAGDMTGIYVAAAGDINGDGMADLIVGATNNDAGGSEAGATYVVFGKTDGFGENLDLTTLNGIDGFKITGARPRDQLGITVSGAGDVNADGYADVVVGNWSVATDGQGPTTAYLLFGKAGGFAADIKLATLDQRDGLRIVGESTGDTTGRAIIGAGDMNGDGYDDIAIGSPGNNVAGSQAGAAYVLYGRPDNKAPIALDGIVHGRENVNYTFALSDFAFSDVDGDGMLAVRITTLATRGTLMLRSDDGNVAAVNVGQDVLATDIANGHLYFAAENFASGSAYATFSFNARDDGGIVGNGQDMSVSPTTLTIGINVDATNGTDLIYGTNGNDTLIASGQQAQLFGLDGDDTYILSNPNQIVNEASGGGRDIIITSVSYALTQGSEVERLEASDSAATTYLQFTGNAFDNHLRGNNGVNSLNGDRGNDILEGLNGDDSYVVNDQGARVIEVAGGGNDTVYATGNYVLARDAEVETLLSYDRSSTTEQNLTGSGENNQILGNMGANVLNGGGGTDSMYGYSGSDMYYVDSADDLVVELYGEGYDTVVASVSYKLPQGMEIEALRTIEQTAITTIDLTGNKIPNLLIGNAGANILDGLGGGDTLWGLGGDDTYIVRNAGDQVVEATGGGNDTLRAAVSYALAAGSEIEMLSALDPNSTLGLRLTGNEFGQHIVGTAGIDAIIGNGGADILMGLGGNDSYIVGGIDTLVSEQLNGGYDTVYTNGSYALAAGSEVETLTIYERSTTNAANLKGNEFANTIYGNAGANVLESGLGSDILFGLDGADTFVFDQSLSVNNVDRIMDFQSGIDKIGLDRTIFAGAPAGALAPSALALGTQAKDADDRVIYDRATGALFYDADGAGGADAIQFASLLSYPTLSASDFLWM